MSFCSVTKLYNSDHTYHLYLLVLEFNTPKLKRVACLLVSRTVLWLAFIVIAIAILFQ